MISASMISDLFINGVGITLVNSLWQGLVLVLVLRILLLIVPRNNVQLKYWLSVTVLTAMVFWTGYTLNHQLSTLMDKYSVSAEEVIGISQETSVIQLHDLSSIPFVKSLFNQMMERLQPYMPSLVVAWFLGVIFFLIRLQGSFIYLRRLKNLGTHPAPLFWQRKVEELTQKLGINTTVKIVESKLAEIPMVIGHLKPVVLLPIGMITGLPTSEIEAILAHELAHIKRIDYLINIAQTVVESLLFFNPAVWWISQTIRKQREHCCDDIAVKCCGNQLVYANALSNLGAWSLKTPALGMGLFKNKNELLMRIKRLVYPQVGVRTIKEKLVPGTVLILTVICLSWYSHRAQAQWMPVQLPDVSYVSLTIAPGPYQKADTIPVTPMSTPDTVPPMLTPLDFEEEVEVDIDIEPKVDIDIADFDLFLPDEDFDVDLFFPEKDFEIFLPQIEELTALSQMVIPDVFLEMDEVEIIIKDLHLQLDDTTRERIRKALEEQREVLEQAKNVQAEALEKAREQLRKSLERDRPDDLTDEEWEMAKNQIRQAERSVERALRHSERALEQALRGHEYELHEQLDRVMKDMDKRIFHKHVEIFEHDQARMKDLARTLHGKALVQRDLAKSFHGNVHRYRDLARAKTHEFRWERRHDGKEAQLRHSLVEDGLLDSYDSDINLIFKKDLVKVNDNKLEGSQKEKYRKLLDQMYGENSSGSIQYKMDD